MLKPKQRTAVLPASKYLADIYEYPEYIKDAYISVDNQENYYFVCVIEDGYDRTFTDTPYDAVTLKIELFDFVGEVNTIAIYRLYIMSILTLIIDYFREVIENNVNFKNFIYTN